MAAFDPRLDGAYPNFNSTEWQRSLTRPIAYNGVYLEDGNLSDDLQPTATNPGDAEKLWKLSEKLVGQEFAY